MEKFPKTHLEYRSTIFIRFDSFLWWNFRHGAHPSTHLLVCFYWWILGGTSRCWKFENESKPNVLCFKPRRLTTFFGPLRFLFDAACFVQSLKEFWWEMISSIGSTFSDFQSTVWSLKLNATVDTLLDIRRRVGRNKSTVSTVFAIVIILKLHMARISATQPFPFSRLHGLNHLENATWNPCKIPGNHKMQNDHPKP